jgi:DNA polymerase (family 10)
MDNARIAGALDDLDLVIGSIRSAMTQSSDETTARPLRAIENPHVDVIGHPSTRIAGGREGLPFDRMAVFAAAARTGTTLEVTANPSRLDLRDVDVRLALEAGARIIINTDAHAPDQLGLLDYGVAPARRGGAMPEDVRNTRSLVDLRAWLQRRG